MALWLFAQQWRPYLLALGASVLWIHGCQNPDSAVKVKLQVDIDQSAEDIKPNRSFLVTAPVPLDTSSVNTLSLYVVKGNKDGSPAICNPSLAIPATITCSSKTTCTISPTEWLVYDTTYTICAGAGIAADSQQSKYDFSGVVGSFSTIGVESLALAPSESTIETGKTQQLIATINYENNDSSTLSEGLTWTSSDPQIASVSSSGLVTAISTGNISITLKDTHSDLTASTNLLVVPSGDEASESGDDVPLISYSIGCTVSGLVGSVVLQNNSGDDLTISSNGIFTFATKQTKATTYNISILSQPSQQTCTLTKGSGTIDSASIADVSLICSTKSFTVGGSVSGLNGTIILRNNGSDDISLTSAGKFSFPTKIAAGAPYSVSVATQPAIQTCTLANASGTVSTGAIESVTVTCSTNTYTVGGTLSGLGSGKTVVLQNNAGDNLTLTSNGSFTFATAVADGSTYATTILTQPTNQSCTLTNASGTISSANITTLGLTCVDLYITMFSFEHDANLGGRSGADSLCNSNRGSLTCSGGLKAMISITTGDTIADMQTNYSIPSSLPIKSTGGTTIASNWATLIGGTLTTSIRSAGVTSRFAYWVGGNNGSTIANNCSNWTANPVGSNGNLGTTNSTSTIFDTNSFTSCSATYGVVLCLCW